MEATATLNRYSTATLRSGKVAVVDNSTRRNLVVLVGTPAEAAEFVDDYYAYLAEADQELAAEAAYARHLEDRAERGWFGYDDGPAF